MTATGHILPLLFVVLLWFGATGLVAWLDNRPPASFRGPLRTTGALAAAGLVAIVATANTGGAGAAYAAFIGAFLIWGWHELAFLTGSVAGPRRAPCPQEAEGWTRFRLAAATVMNHELVLAATLVLLAAAVWHGSNFVGVAAFAILFGMRLSAKLNIFLGVPNFDAGMLPPQLGYLRSYFRVRAFNALMPISLAAGGALTWWLGTTAIAAPSEAATGWSLLAAIALLGVVEHLFLVLPFRDGALWRWAVPAR